jgi:hypothetical protein
MILGCEMSKLRIRLVGGVGNQLFCYYAGAALAGKNNLQLVADASWTDPKVTNHESSIADFDLPGIWKNLPQEGKPIQKSIRVLNRNLDRIAFRLPSVRKMRGIKDNSLTLGWDPEIFKQPSPKFLWGYFQSWKYVHLAHSFGYPLRPKLKSRSHRLQELIREAEQQKAISVHIRRGDYLNVKNFSLLGKTYYAESISTLRDIGHHGPIWVFSDSPEMVYELIQPDRLISDLGAVEQMFLMASCDAHVIANSSFSWWGAWLDENQGTVIAPSPSFKNGPAIQDLIPPTWIQVPHT